MTDITERLRADARLVENPHLYETQRLELCAADEIDRLRGLLREAREDWIKVGYGASHEDVAACRDFCARIDAALGTADREDAGE